MRQLEKFMLGVLLLGGALTVGVTFAVGQSQDNSQQPRGKTVSKATQTASPKRGARVFEQNCSRCHNAPQGLSPSVSGAVAMHMRVRANLSDEDYKALRQFLNP
jgi:cytochrome c5